MRAILLLIVVFGTTKAFCQKEGNIWYFGHNVGLDFNHNPPIVLNNSKMYTGASCSTISDKKGMLLFYTDGVTVWNKNHQCMENGTGLFGHKYSTQTALIVKQPLNDSLYYIFTTDHNEGFIWPDTFNRGVNYSIVNIKLNNGLGKVVIKNINILKSSTQKIAAIRHRNGKDVWIITPQFFTTNIYSYLLAAEGINFTPVISITKNKEIMGSGGCLKGSPDGDYLVKVNTGSYYDIFKFDNSTGLIFNYITILRPADCSRGSSAEFSTDESKLYLSSYMADNKSPAYITQYNLKAGSPKEIEASGIIVGTFPCCTHANTLLMGPDLKIYVSNFNYIGVINSPDEIGSKCKYKDSSICFDNRWVQNFPNLINDYYRPLKTETNKVSSQDDLMIYPNPVLNGSSFILKSNHEQMEMVKIIDIKGSEICNYNHLYKSELILNSTRFNAGTYYAVIYTSNRNTIRKFVIIK